MRLQAASQKLHGTVVQWQQMVRTVQTHAMYQVFPPAHEAERFVCRRKTNDQRWVSVALPLMGKDQGW